MSDLTPKEIAVGKALRQIHDAIGRDFRNPEITAKAWVRWIPDIPENYIQRSFDLAMARGGRASIPVPEKVTAAFRELKKDDNWKDTKVGERVNQKTPAQYNEEIGALMRKYPHMAQLFSEIDVTDSRPADSEWLSRVFAAWGSTEVKGVRI